MQNPHSTGHLHPRFYLQSWSDPVGISGSPQPGWYRPCKSGCLCGRGGCPKREGLNGEGGSHVLGLTGLDLAGGNEHETHLAAGVKELDGAVVVRENSSVGVVDGDVLRESEADGVVGDGEGGKLDGGDRNLGVFGFKDGEVYYEDNDEEKDQENGGDYARGKICTA